MRSRSMYRSVQSSCMVSDDRGDSRRPREQCVTGAFFFFILKIIFICARPLAAAPPLSGRPGRGAAGSPSPQNCRSESLAVVLDILDTNKNH